MGDKIRQACFLRRAGVKAVSAFFLTGLRYVQITMPTAAGMNVQVVELSGELSSDILKFMRDSRLSGGVTDGTSPSCMASPVADILPRMRYGCAGRLSKPTGRRDVCRLRRRSARTVIAWQSDSSGRPS